MKCVECNIAHSDILFFINGIAPPVTFFDFPVSDNPLQLTLWLLFKKPLFRKLPKTLNGVCISPLPIKSHCHYMKILFSCNPPFLKICYKTKSKCTLFVNLPFEKFVFSCLIFCYICTTKRFSIEHHFIRTHITQTVNNCFIFRNRHQLFETFRICCHGNGHIVIH